MLSMGLENFRVVQEREELIILSTLDNWTLDSKLPGKTDIHVYAEDVTINSSVKLRNAYISAHQILWDNEACINLSGINGTSAQGVNMQPEKSGSTGGCGGSGGTFFIYMESGQPEHLLLPVIADGGSGGRGQEGTLNTAGGNGGDGGNGGNVYVLYRHPYTKFVEELEFVNNLKGETKRRELEAFIARANWEAPCCKTMKIHVDRYRTDKDAEACIAGLAMSASVIVETAPSEFILSADPGEYGTRGEGTPSGENGKRGMPGVKNVIRFTKLSSFSSNVLPPVKPIHVVQCRMLLEKASLMYFSMRDETVQDVALVLQKLVERTEVFQDRESKNPLLSLYKNEELEELYSIHREAAGLLNNIKNGLDYFGYDARFVPLASFSFYQEIQNQLIDSFMAIDKGFHKYYEDLKGNKASMDVLDTVIGQLEKTIKQNGEALEKLKADLSETGKQISSYQSPISYLRNNLISKINDFEDIISKHFALNLKDAQMALSTLVNTPTSMQKWVDTFIAMGGNRLINFSDDYGKEINRDYIIAKMKTVSGEISSVITSFKQENDGGLEFDELSACKLLVREDEIFGMLDSFYAQFPDELTELKESFREYVSTVISRNTQIILYNAMFSQFIQVSSERESKCQKLEKVKREGFKKMDPNLPEVASLVSQTYYSARRDLMETLVLTARAYRLWSLNDENIIADMYKKSPPELNCSFLNDCQSGFIKAYRRAVEEFGRNASVFPAEAGQKGIELELTPLQVKSLKHNNTVLVAINPATFQSKKSETPFYGYYNIRIDNVRVWVDGAQTRDNALHVNIQHTGAEQYVNADNKLLAFRHNPVTASFQYNTRTKEIYREGDMGWRDEDAKKYALIGPFTTWRISLKCENNLDLKLSQVSGVVMEFHGRSYAMP